MNSGGTQDLIVHILGRSRYEVANYDNYAIPTNIDVAPAVKDNFGAFYAASLGQDLVFRAAPGVEGGRGVPDKDGGLPRGITASGYNNFQGRYVIRHPWAGPIECEDPERGVWGGPVQQVAGGPLKVATNTAFAPRGGIDLAVMITSPVPELEGQAERLPSGPVTENPWPTFPTPPGAGIRSPGHARSQKTLSQQ